jgi:quinol monooxygenase YgiN
MAELRFSLLTPTERIREISGALGALARRACHDTGCITSEVYASLKDPNHLVLQGEWRSDEDLARYVRSKDFTQVLSLFEMAAEPPFVEFRVAGKTRGLDYVSEVREVQTSIGK